MLVTTGNDIGPRTSVEILIATFGIFMGAVINANVFGELAVLVTAISAKNNDF